jgi:uncharacterized protein (DUF58 family)
MKVRPGKRLVGLFLGLAVWSTMGLIWLPLLLPIPLVLVGVGMAATTEYRKLRQNIDKLTVNQRVPNLVARGRSFQVEIEIANPSKSPFSASVRVEAPEVAEPKLWHEPLTIAADGSTLVHRSFRIPQRGKFAFGPTWLRLLGPLGLLEAQRSYAAPIDIQVYPESLCSREELAKDSADEARLLEQLRYSRHRGVGTEFESLEDFRFGDDLRRIDWRATARSRRPIVRRYQIERHRDLIVLVDCGRLMGTDAKRGTKLDCAVDAALRLMRLALRGGDRCGLGIFDDQVLGYFRPIGGRGAMQTFVSCLYDVQSRYRESDFAPMFATLQSRQSKRALVVVLSDVVDAETSARYRTSLCTLSSRHVVLFVALQSPILREYIESPLNSLDDGFKKAVVFRLLRQRQQAIHELRRSGVHVLDVEPAHLTTPLVNQFIELRGANTL